MSCEILNLSKQVCSHRSEWILEKRFHHVTRGIFIKENKLLLVRAAGYEQSFLPGGHVELGESAKHALVREMEEEMGIHCVIGPFLGVIEHHWEENGCLNHEINQLFFASSTALNIDVSPPSLEAHITFFWGDIEALETYNLEPSAFVQMFRRYRKGKSNLGWASSLLNKDDDKE